MKKRVFEELRVVKYFAPNIERTARMEILLDMWYPEIEESESGLTPEKAYIMYTSTKKKSFAVTDRFEFHRLIVGQRLRDMQVKMWKEGKDEVSYNELIGTVPHFVLRFLSKNI